MFRKLLFVCYYCVVFTSAYGQFRIDRAVEDFGFQSTRKYNFYSRTRFNRVEALFLNVGLKVRPQNIQELLLYGDVGHGFKNEEGKRLRWNAGIEKKFFVPNQLTLGIRGFDDVVSNDRWQVSSLENSLAGVFLHEDFMDYYGKEGGLLFADYLFAQVHTLRLELAGHRYEEVQSNSGWSLFGTGKSYLANPRTGFPIVAGNEKAVKLIGVFDWRDNPIFPIIGWYADVQFERTFDDFETTALFATIKRHQPTISDHKFQIKLLAGTRTGSFAAQHLLNLGGIGSLRGYREKELVGDRLLFLTANYVIGQDWLYHVPLRFLPFWEAVGIGVFAETGLAWFADPQNPDAGLFSTGEFSVSDMKSDVGLSLYLADNLLRVDFAQRLDRSRDNWRIMLRILDRF